MKIVFFSLAVAALLFAAAPPCRAADADPLAGILIAGEDWQVAAENLGFADGTCADAEGNIYFSDLKAKPAVIYKLAPDGKQTVVAQAGMSGNKIGPDGKLYSVGGGKLMVFDLATGAGTKLAEGMATNDLVVSHNGDIYCTETGKSQITLVDPKTGQKKAVDVGISKPNGIALTPDQKTLLVSDYGGLNVWSFTIQPDGSLTDKKALMTMKAPENKPTVAGGDGMTVDTAGRSYVTTAIGLQVFGANGELLGVLPKPQPGALVNAAFGGTDHKTLYLACGTKVFKRKTQATGALFFEEPR